MQRYVSCQSEVRWSLLSCFKLIENVDMHLPYLRVIPSLNKCNFHIISSFHKLSSVCCSIILLGNRALVNSWSILLLWDTRWIQTLAYFIDVHSFKPLFQCLIEPSASANKCTVHKKKFAHLYMSHHQYCTIVQVHPCFKNE